jgi:hypothetical protein
VTTVVSSTNPVVAVDLLFLVILAMIACGSRLDLRLDGGVFFSRADGCGFLLPLINPYLSRNSEVIGTAEGPAGGWCAAILALSMVDFLDRRGCCGRVLGSEAMDSRGSWLGVDVRLGDIREDSVCKDVSEKMEVGPGAYLPKYSCPVASPNVR